MLSIKNNLMAENAARNLGRSYSALAKSVQRLSSGLRINSAKDDAAGLAVRELIRADVATLRQGSRNAADAVSMLQAAEGGLSVVDDILIRMRELAEQAATDSYSSDQKAIMQAEFAELAAEITRIANNTDFDDNNLLETDAGDAMTIALGLGIDVATKVIKIDTHDVTATGLGVGGTIESYASNYWVANSDTAKYLSEDNTNASDLSFTFGAQDAIVVNVAANAQYTLDELVTAVNNASRLTTQNYDAAEAHYDSESGQYTLKLSASTAGAIATTIAEDVGTGGGNLVWGTNASTLEVATTDFIETAGTGTVMDISSDADAAITALNAAINEKDTFRAHLGYMMNRLEAAISVIDIQAENLLAAESRISDVDVATEMASLTKTQVLTQAGIAMLGQANIMPQMALQLLG